MSTVQSPIETTIQKSKTVLHAIESSLEFVEDEVQAYEAFRAVMSTVRDRLSVAHANSLAAQMTPLLRGWYYEGWQPEATPIKMDDTEFQATVEQKIRSDHEWPIEETIQGVVTAVGASIEPETIETIKAGLPESVAQLLP